MDTFFGRISAPDCAHLPALPGSRRDGLWFLKRDGMSAVNPHLFRAWVQARDIDSFGIGIIRQR